MEHASGPQNSQESLGSNTKVQGLIQALLSQSIALPWFDLVHKRSFVH